MSLDAAYRTSVHLFMADTAGSSDALTEVKCSLRPYARLGPRRGEIGFNVADRPSEVDESTVLAVAAGSVSQ
jgi:hypothetical protein